MFELAVSADLGTVVGLIVVSLLALIAGTVLRAWPEKVQEYAESIDGSFLFISPEAHANLIGMCSRVLILLSFVALSAGTFVLARL